MAVKKAVRKLTSRKAGGVCGIHVEVVKVGEFEEERKEARSV